MVGNLQIKEEFTAQCFKYRYVYNSGSVHLRKIRNASVKRQQLLMIRQGTPDNGLLAEICS
jgi:hypothetical protein